MAQRTSGRLKISKNPEELLVLAKGIAAKHIADGDTSPLKLAVDYNWDTIEEKINRCLSYHKEAEEHKRKMEECYRERDIDFPYIDEAVRNGGAILKGLFAKNPKRLGEWGYTVDDTKRATKKD